MIMIFISVNRSTWKMDGVWGLCADTQSPLLSQQNLFFNKKANRQKAEVKQ